MIYRIPLDSVTGVTKIRPFIVLTLALTGCAAAPSSQSVNDPLEPMNREIHSLNQAVDKAVLRPVATAFAGKGGSGFMGERVGDFADHLGKPADVLNNVLQLRLAKAATNTLRFGFNTVFGLGGLIDVATEAGMPENKTDFGETLHIWGFGEGVYLELPLAGPSTGRDLVGTIVDYVIDPLNALPEPEKYIGTAAKLGSKLGDRGRYSDTVDSILYDSADSYAQARILYLQNRRYELGQTSDDAGFVDPYEDPYGQ